MANKNKQIIIQLKDDNQVGIRIKGEMKFEEVIDMLHTAEYDFLNTFNDQTDGKFKKEIYKRSVLGYSLMADKFYPEGKNSKFAGLTEEAVMKAQDQVIREKAKRKK
jgi:hypothetical protein